jgi:uncharacterized LabA/DUF88 family protein
MFIDWENIKYSLLNRDNRLPNVQALKDAAGRFGRVVTAKAYANWQEGHNLRDPNDLYSVGIEPIYVPTIFVGPGDATTDGLPRRKNSVDIKLAVDVVEFAYLNPSVATFVFVTGDGDFIHLVNTLRTHGKRVVIIGASWNTSWMLTSSADQYIAYDVDVDPAPARRPAPLVAASTAPPHAPTPAPAPVAAPLVAVDEAFKVLGEVVKYVREKRRPNVFAQVKLLLASRLGSFDEQAYGYSKFKDFMKEAERRGIVKTQTVGLTDRVYMPGEEIDTGLAVETPQEVEREAEEAVQRIGETPPPPPLRNPVVQRSTVKLDPVDEERLTKLVRFVDLLEQGSPFMSFNYIVNRAAESRLVPMTLNELSDLVDQAIQDGMFLTDTRTILDRITGEYRDINIFRLNRRHPLVMRALEEPPGTNGIEPVAANDVEIESSPEIAGESGTSAEAPPERPRPRRRSRGRGTARTDVSAVTEESSATEELPSSSDDELITTNGHDAPLALPMGEAQEAEVQSSEPVEASDEAPATERPRPRRRSRGRASPRVDDAAERVEPEQVGAPTEA